MPDATPACSSLTELITVVVSGVTVIDTSTFKVAGQISTGVGRHEIVVSGDNRFAFISNRDSGTVSIVDVHELQKIKDLEVGPSPVSLALSELSKAIYAVSEGDGSVAVIDTQGKVLTRIKAKPGSRLVRFAPGDRYGFVLNTNESTVSVFDARTGTLFGDTGGQLDDAADAAGIYPDSRSNRGGSEPEGIDLTHARGFTLAAVALERASGIALVDVSNPATPTVIAMADLFPQIGPETVKFFRRGSRLFVASANEVSGTVSILEVVF